MDEIDLHGQQARDFIELIAAGISIDEALELVLGEPQLSYTGIGV